MPPDKPQFDSDQSRRAALRALFAPRHVAVIGASRTPGKIGHSVVHNLIKGGFAGRIFPINAAGGEVEGLACLRSAAELPDAVDCAMLVVPAKETVEAIRACADKGVRSAIIGAVGFAETGTAQGRQAAGRGRGSRATPECGSSAPTPTASPTRRRSFRSATTPRTVMRSRPGRSRSSRTAARCSAASFVRSNNSASGSSKFVPVGNEADLDMLDILDYAIEDPDTQVIGLAIEALANGARFRELAMRAKARDKPIVALKLGRSAAGVGAALAHSSRLAGGARAYDALFSACGVASVRSIEALAATCALLARYPERAADPRLICVTTSGAGGALLADHAAERGFVLAGDAIGEWQGEAGAAIAAMDSRGHLRNPLDVGALADWPDLAHIYALLERHGLFGPTVCYAHIAPRPEQDATLLAVLRGRKERTRAPIVVIAPGGLEPALEQQYQDSGIALFHETALGFDVLAAHRAAGAPALFAELLTPSAAARAAADRLAKMHRRRALRSRQRRDPARIWRAAGRKPRGDDLGAGRRRGGSVGYPLVLKAMVPGVAHKNAAGLVITSISNKTELDRAHAALTERTRGKPVCTFCCSRCCRRNLS